MDVARRCVRVCLRLCMYVCVCVCVCVEREKNEYIKDIKTEMFLFLGGDNVNHPQFMGNLMCKTNPINT